MPDPNPAASLIPKDATRVSDLARETRADGTGVAVAVLDTGVDPGAPGLSVTAAGARKLLDVVDCTCSGDVDTSTTVAPENGVVTGLSGRPLRLTPDMLRLNAAPVFRVGLKRGFELFPATLVKRLRKERRDLWDRRMRRLLNSVRATLAELRDANDPRVDEFEARQAVLLAMEKNYRDHGPLFDCVVFHDGTNWRAVVDVTERGALDQCVLLEDFCINGRFAEFANGIMMNFAVNVYDDGNVLSIVVDGGSHGTHVAGILAANFPDAPHLNGLAPGAQIVSLKIGDSRLSSMETHQGIIRALGYLLNHSLPDDDHNPDSDTSPTSGEDAASATSEQVGDEAKTKAKAKAKAKAKDAASQTSANAPEAKQTRIAPSKRSRVRIDVVNMSFGEHSRDVNRGRFVTLVNRLVHKHNVLFLSSAGNEGPGLSSVSAPGGTTDAMIGVGAYVTPAMLTQAYSLLHSEFGNDMTTQTGRESMSSSTPRRKCEETGVFQEREPVAGMPYTWSSRGPVSDGAMGVDICAPGGAIAPVPLWMLRKKMLMNGTSMSSPSAAGAVATILSFLKSRGIPYTSALVKRAIQNTARPLKPPRLGPELGEKVLITASSDKGQQRCRYDSEYYRDLVFAAGHGSIDALAACKYIERYMSTRKTIPTMLSSQDQAVTSQVNVPPKKPPMQTSSSKHSENGPVPDPESFYSSMLEDCEDSSFTLEDWRIKIQVEDGSPARRGSSSPGCGALNTTRGIYMRGLSETSASQRAIVSVEAVGQREDCLRTKRALAKMEVNISIQCDAPWVEVPSSVVLLGGGRSFPVILNPERLAAGRAHFAEILGFVRHEDGKSPISGPVFRVPITVHKPETLVGGLMINPLREVSFAPGSVVRRFYEAPLGASYALLKITTGTSSFLTQPVRGTHASEAGSAVEFSDLSFNLPSLSEDTENVTVPEKATTTSGPALNGSRVERESDTTTKTQLTPKYASESPTKVPKPGWVSGSADARNFEAHVVQLGPQRHCGELETRQYFTLRPGTVKECVIRIQAGSTLELCLAQMWSSPGRSLIESVELIFGGVIPIPGSLHCSSGSLSFPRIEVARFLPAPTSTQSIAQIISGYSPRGSLTHLQRAISPSKSKIRALSPRDTLPDSDTTFQLQLDYSFEVFESSSSVKLLFPGLNRAVYEAEIEGGPYVTIHDRNKQFLCASDIYPFEATLSKGEYTATAYVRLDRAEVLERLKDMRVTVKYDLSSEISLDAYNTSHAACLGLDERKSSKGTAPLESGERRAFYFAIPKRSSLPKWATAGDLLVGQMTIDKLLSAAGNNSRRGNDMPTYEITYGVGPSSSSSNKNDSDSGEERQKQEDSGGAAKASKKKDETGTNNQDKPEQAQAESPSVEANPDQWFEEAVRKLKLKRLRSLLKENKFSAFDALYKGMHEKYPDDVEVLVQNLERLDVEASRAHRKEGVTEDYRGLVDAIVKTADEIVRRLDMTAVATHFGMMIDPESTEETSRRKNFETKRSQLAEVTFRKARALCNLALSHVAPDRSPEGGDAEAEKRDSEALEVAMKDLLRWASVDGKGSLPGGSHGGVRDGSTSNEDLTMLCASRELKRGRVGIALRVLDNYYGSMASKKNEAEDAVVLRERLLRELDWQFLAERERCYRAVRFPKHVAPY